MSPLVPVSLLESAASGRRFLKRGRTCWVTTVWACLVVQPLCIHFRREAAFWYHQPGGVWENSWDDVINPGLSQCSSVFLLRAYFSDRWKMCLQRHLHSTHTLCVCLFHYDAWTERLREDAFSHFKGFHACSSDVTAANIVGCLSSKNYIEGQTGHQKCSFCSFISFSCNVLYHMFSNVA